MKKLNLNYKIDNWLNESTVLNVDICDGQVISRIKSYNNNEHIEKIAFLPAADKYCLDSIKSKKGALPEEVWKYKRGQQYFPVQRNPFRKIYTNQIVYHNLQLIIMLPYIYEINKKPYIYSYESGTIIPSKIHLMDEDGNYMLFKTLFPDIAWAVYNKSDLMLKDYQSRQISIKRY